MFEFRHYRNSDSPQLMQLWNESMTGRSAYSLNSVSSLERWIFSKPYFDPAGLVLAVGDGRPVGFAHAGFGPNDERTGLDDSTGVIWAVVVSPSWRNRGVGRQLVHQLEMYLGDRGATRILAGAQKPNHPFGFGLYGGSDSAGFLDSDRSIAAFLRGCGYQRFTERAIYQRRLDQAISVIDARFVNLRRRYEMVVQPRIRPGTWWDEAILGPIEPYEAALLDRTDKSLVARSLYWELEGFGHRWGVPACGIMSLSVLEPLRRRGLAKLLLASLFRHLHEKYFGLVEIQSPGDHEVMPSLLRSLGFQQVDVGAVYRKILR